MRTTDNASTAMMVTNPVIPPMWRVELSASISVNSTVYVHIELYGFVDTDIIII